MINPIAQNRKYLLIYLSIWALITEAHFAFLYLVINQSFIFSLADSILFNSTYSLIGMAIWYVVRYNDFEFKKFDLVSDSKLRISRAWAVG